MRNRTWFVALALFVIALLVGACGPTPAATTAAPGAAKLKVGLVTDVGKVDDKSFNQSSWEGVQCAQKDLGLDTSTTKYLETSDPKDYDKNIAQFADQKYDVIVTVGFALGEATYKAAKKYPNTMFIGVDQFQANDKEGTPELINVLWSLPPSELSDVRTGSDPPWRWNNARASSSSFRAPLLVAKASKSGAAPWPTVSRLI